MRQDYWSLPDLWHTPPRLYAEELHYMPSSVQFEESSKSGTSQVLLFADNQSCLPFPWSQKDNLGLLFHLHKSQQWLELLLLKYFNCFGLHILVWHQPSSVISISPWYSVWEGSTLRKGRMTFPIINVVLTSSPTPLTERRKKKIHVYFLFQTNGPT